MALKLAIVGRPNVGKSTLFNRLAGKKLAIVDDLPGVTRDRKEAPGRLGDLDLHLIDTAGFEDLTDESLEARMRSQTETAIADADLALFLVDARAGVTPLDKRFAELLRRSGKPVVIAANKHEGKAGESGWLEAFSLGFGEPVALSAEHGEGMSELYAEIVAKTPAEPEAEETEEDRENRPIRLAIIGRPNAGKSTLVNALLGEERMLVGPKPGSRGTRSPSTGSGRARKSASSTPRGCAARRRCRAGSKTCRLRTRCVRSVSPTCARW